MTEPAHARLAPSSANIWMTCPGQPTLADKAPAERPSVHAAEGTFYHEIAAACLRGGSKASRYLGHTDEVDGFSFTANADDLDYLQVYLDYCGSLERSGDVVGVEERLKYSDDYWGTADFWRYDPKAKSLHVVDLKMGRGVLVEAEDNRQMLSYALMASMLYPKPGDLKSITLVIIQPRAQHIDGVVREHEIDMLDLLEFQVDVDAAIEATRQPDAPTVAGVHCKWCKAAGFCPTLKSASLDAARRNFREGDAWTPEDLAEALASVEMVKNWCASVESLAYEQANVGKCPPGWKLVDKRATTKWIDEDSARKALTERGYEDDDIAKSKLLTPAQLRKVLHDDDKELLDGMTTRQNSGTVLVPESDKRPRAAAAAFDVVTVD